jgi:hypothetical protein
MSRIVNHAGRSVDPGLTIAPIGAAERSGVDRPFRARRLGRIGLRCLHRRAEEHLELYHGCNAPPMKRCRTSDARAQS